MLESAHDEEAQRLSQQLLAARRAVRTIGPISSADPRFDTRRAYEVAKRNHDALLAAGDTAVGRKIGFTNRGIWDEYRVYEPIWAHVYASTAERLSDARGTLRCDALCQPRIEPEMIVQFARAPDVAEPHRIAECVEWVAHGFEIVDCHFADWKFTAADTIADFGLHGRLLIGEPLPIANIPDPVRTLSEFEIALARNGEIVDRGRGRNVLDGPLHAIAYLMRVLEGQPQFAPIAAGEIITTGTLTRAWPIAAGQVWRTTLDGVALPGATLECR